MLINCFFSGEKKKKIIKNQSRSKNCNRNVYLACYDLQVCEVIIIKQSGPPKKKKKKVISYDQPLSAFVFRKTFLESWGDLRPWNCDLKTEAVLSIKYQFLLETLC